MFSFLWEKWREWHPAWDYYFLASFCAWHCISFKLWGKRGEWAELCLRSGRFKWMIVVIVSVFATVLCCEELYVIYLFSHNNNCFPYLSAGKIVLLMLSRSLSSANSGLLPVAFNRYPQWAVRVKAWLTFIPFPLVKIILWISLGH